MIDWENFLLTNGEHNSTRLNDLDLAVDKNTTGKLQKGKKSKIVWNTSSR